MVINHEIRSIVLPCPARTNVRKRANWTFDLQTPRYIGPMPMDIPHNVNVEDDKTDDEYERRHMSPVHDALRPSTHTASGSPNLISPPLPLNRFI